MSIDAMQLQWFLAVQEFIGIWSGQSKVHGIADVNILYSLMQIQADNMSVDPIFVEDWLKVTSEIEEQKRPDILRSVDVVLAFLEKERSVGPGIDALITSIQEDRTQAQALWTTLTDLKH